jgi:multidrug efflux pump subunit AcrA (membrane-fusion protein)
MSKKLLRIIQKWGFPALLCLVVVAAFLTRSMWWSPLTHWVEGTIQAQRPAADEQKDAEAEKPGGGASTSLELSAQARRNIGLDPESLRPLHLQTFRKTISVPAVVVERPGRTRIEVSTPLTGIITHVHSVAGEAVLPGTLLFEIRLTHEDLVRNQTDFVKTLGELDVEKKELARLKKIPEEAIAGKILLEHEYAIDKLTASLNAQRESLRLHGLNEEQIEKLETNRSLLQSLQIYAPSVDSHSEDEFKFTQTKLSKVSLDDKPARPLVMQELHVKKGQSVTAGESLCELVDYSQLFVEGRAFERDANAVSAAMQRGWTVTAMFESSSGYEEKPDLPFAYVANKVDPETRTLSFFVDLPNTIVRDEQNSQNQRFITWKYRPGQRLQLLVPVEEWEKQFVLPVDAVVKEGAEYFVFQENGDHFDRIPVHVKYKDQTSVVIDNDGSLFPGNVIARRGAHQMQMALKNKSGGGADPHAGHTH